MSRDTFNAAEQFLLKQWPESRQLEESMEGVRNKYKATWQRIADVVKEETPELDWNVLYVTQFWSKGSAGFGRKAWPDTGRGWGAGIWIDRLRLETLTDPQVSSPNVYWWVQPLKKGGVDPTEAKRALIAAASRELSAGEKALITLEAGDEESALRYDLPEKQQLLAMLMEGDSQQFVDAIVTPINLLARFISVIDRLVAKTKPMPQQ